METVIKIKGKLVYDQSEGWLKWKEVDQNEISKA